MATQPLIIIDDARIYDYGATNPRITFIMESASGVNLDHLKLLADERRHLQVEVYATDQETGSRQSQRFENSMVYAAEIMQELQGYKFEAAKLWNEVQVLKTVPQQIAELWIKLPLYHIYQLPESVVKAILDTVGLNEAIKRKYLRFEDEYLWCWIVYWYGWYMNTDNDYRFEFGTWYKIVQTLYQGDWE